jgi:N-acetylmuramoyl-L-alanine amidase
VSLKQKKYIEVFISVVTLVFLYLPAGFAVADTSRVAEVNVGTLNVRSGPGTEHQRAGTVSAGMLFEILSSQGDWLQVRLTQGGSGWIFSGNGYASVHNISGTVQVTVDGLNVRAGPGTSHANVSRVSRGVFPYLAERNGWYRILLPQGRAGWVSGQFAVPVSAGGSETESLPGAAVVRASTLNVRSGPGTEFGILSQVRSEMFVPVLESRSNWHRVLLPDDSQGWIAGSFAEFMAPDSKSSRTAMINVPSLNMRSGPSTGYRILGTGTLGSEFKIINSVPGWFNILTEKNNTAWISANHSLIRHADGGSGDAALAGKTIVIDPGHGGSDPGAVGRLLLLTEKFVNLDTALRLERLLQNTGARVVLTRRTDVFIPLSQRVNIAHNNNADIFVSIHANAHNDRNIDGTETYFSTSFRSQDSFRLATVLQQELVSELRLRDIGVKAAGFHVIHNTRMPSALVELAFLSNPREEELLNQAAFRQKAAEAVYRGIVRFLQ